MHVIPLSCLETKHTSSMPTVLARQELRVVIVFCSESDEIVALGYEARVCIVDLLPAPPGRGKSDIQMPIRGIKYPKFP